MSKKKIGTRISIIGSGTVGYAVGRGFLEKGNKVIFHDVNRKRVLELKAKGYQATKDVREAVKKSEISFISVPTPNSDGKQDLSYIKQAVEGVAKAIRDKEKYHLIVLKSTVLPGTVERIIIPIVEKYSDKKVGGEVGVCMNPEFLTEASPLRDFINPDRIVIGQFDEKSGSKLESLYSSFKAPIYRTELRTAEMIKYAANCFFVTKISYFNQIWQLCKKLGIDGKKVAEITGKDPRIGEYGTKSGRGFDGKCLPKDLQAFIEFLERKGSGNPSLVRVAKEINDKMREKYGVFRESGISWKKPENT